MEGIQREDSEALSHLYDRYNGILKALVLRVIHNEAEADDLLQEIFMPVRRSVYNARLSNNLMPGSTIPRRRKSLTVTGAF